MSDLIGVEEARLHAAVDAALRRVRTPESMWATVASWDPLSNDATAIIDGDGTAIPVVNATNGSLAAGQRALVLFVPPSGAVVIGARPAVPIVYEPTFSNVDVDDGTAMGYWSMAGGWVDFAAEFVLGTSGAVSGAIELTLPVPMVAVFELGENPVVVVARATVAPDVFAGTGSIEPTVDPSAVVELASVEGTWAAAVPGSWSLGDELRVTGRYPVRLPVGLDE